MNLIDGVVVVLLLLGLLAGARAGFLGPVLGLAGAATGFGLLLLITSSFRESLATIEQPERALVTLLGLVAFVIGGEALGTALGASMSHGIRRGSLRSFDALGGAVVGAAHVVLLVWLVGGVIAAGMAPGLGAAWQESGALRLAGERLPPPAIVAGRLMTLLDMTGLPPLFSGLEPAPAAPVDLPADAEARALAESALASTARIASSGCGSGQMVGSGFFVSPVDLVTNAHVVAGGSETTVTLGESVHQATVVAFDPDADLALLHVPGAAAPPLELSTTVPLRGTAAVALGYPGGADLAITPAAVTASYGAVGPDIYGDGVSARSVIEMRADIRRGNSGGPLMVAPRVVGGVVFGASRVSPSVGYAIGADEALESIGPFFGSTAPVDTGACL